MAGLGVTEFGLERVQERFVMNGRDLVGRTMRTVLQQRLPEAVTFARATYLTGGTTSTRLAERTGKLKKSFDAEVTGASQGIIGRIGYLHGPSWAGVHEGWPDRRGSTTIRPRTARYLAIPLTPEATAHRPRDFSNTFAQTSRRGNLIVFAKTAGGGITPLYLLRTSVIVPARPALYPTMDRFIPIITEDLRKAGLTLLRGT